MARPGARPRLEPGRRLTVRFSGLAADGAAVAQVGAARIAVRYAIPGEEALIQVVRTSPAPLGAIVAVQRKSPDAATPPCPHFGRCGGCQLQHITLPAQRREKRALVVAALREVGVPPDLVRPCTGGQPWGYRSLLRATFDRRGPAVIAGFFGWGEQRLYNIASCPVQHPTNVRILHVVREAVRALDLPPYNRRRGSGLVRGVLGMTGQATGEALAVLSAAGPLPDRMAFVRAILDRVPGLVGLLLTVQPGHSTAFFGRSLALLWGRDYLEDEILGLRVRLRADAHILPNPGALPLLLQAVAQAGELRGDEQVLDAFAEAGLLTLALAQRVRRSVGVVSDRQAMTEAWFTAQRNGIANAVFYTRDPARVLAKLHQRGERTDVLVTAPPGEGLPQSLLDALAAVGPQRVVYVGRSLAVTARDLERLRRAAYRVRSVQPVDLFPQTGHVHAVVGLHRA
ncbi:MAG: 23S rRNA (uracil(1939)-C(5))-methyltransferase RlmD [Armatimonadota bacterium]|nr:23S rRNA (uracil(1939)-C(5))-methyltransferase RlmD [Armatimonadota bacterium]MDR7426407.1 23S rRNA (uracil(1939)-C(5))-methyltransferase RlmD [Armatimonadota bacterium]MDR7465311.1 23S rRNA (uracil(1939)-C(5))-methyltransferase RlmD [Armatimonadota bacterium]MDR7469538.1 23S rRNA (uracil(1939)-C(5))-methyltransferase RlmD [Armatimonadota bacterium]MDR7473454.1 23S rRNA (uracil(1939)-C(5))-methyltransferase RlmD [Armatimonadota bacterium]